MNENNTPLYEFKKEDKKIFLLFLLVFPILMIINNLDDNDYKVDFEKLFIWVLITLNSIGLVWLTLFKWLKKINNTRSYFSIAFKFLSLNILLIVIETCFYWFLLERNTTPFTETWDQTLNIFIVSFIVSPILFGILMFRKSIDAQIQLHKNKSIQKSNELRILKSQVDPHFLFNNLNTLDALVDIDTKKAKKFIEHLGYLYQYILVTKDEDVIELEREVDFAKNYIYLIKVRFDENYQFKIIDDRKKNDENMIPTGALQTALENIVKHNNAIKLEPIKTTIIINDDQIVISNNIRSKTKPLKSFKIGLNNLQSRYEILSNRNLEVEINDFYTIKLPLLNVLKA